VADIITICDGGSAKRRHVAAPTPDETGLRGWTTSDRAQARTDLSSMAARRLASLRDSSWAKSTFDGTLELSID